MGRVAMAAKPPRKRARTKVPNDDSQKHGAAAAREPPSGTPGKPVEMRSRLVPQEGDGVLERMCKVMLANLGLDACFFEVVRQHCPAWRAERRQHVLWFRSLVPRFAHSVPSPGRRQGEEQVRL